MYNTKDEDFDKNKEYSKHPESHKNGKLLSCIKRRIPYEPFG